jgi:transcriptional antiterminator NusG
MAVEKASPRDNFLLVVGLAIVAAGIAGFFYYADEVMTIIRAVGLVVAVVVASLVVLQTQRGRDMFGFVREADEQRRKVVWPTRQETFQTTLIVIFDGQRVRLADPSFDWHGGRQLMSKKWYVVHAYSGFEKQVQSSLQDYVKRAGMEDFFGEILVPTEEVVEMKKGVKRRSERKFFPGYVLVEMEMNDDSWHLVKSVPKVLGFIGGRQDQPAPITQREADSILQRVAEGVDKPRPKILFEPGEVVRVIDGPFNDFSGVVEEINYEKSRLRVAVSIFGRSTPVELDFQQVEKL